MTELAKLIEDLTEDLYQYNAPSKRRVKHALTKVAKEAIRQMILMNDGRAWDEEVDGALKALLGEGAGE